MNEDPQSITVRGFYKGYSMLVTIRDTALPVKPLVDKAIEAIEYMEFSQCNPDWNEKEEPSGYTPNQDPHEAHVCQKCHAQLVFKQGISKAGKKYAGYFCPNAPKGDKTHTTEWA